MDGKARIPVHKHGGRWPAYVNDFVKETLAMNPGIYVDELRSEVRRTFPEVSNVSLSTVMRVLRFDLGYTLKVMTKRAYEARAPQIDLYFSELQNWYWFPEQLLFIDETSKDAKSAYRKRGWGQRGLPAFTREQFEHGKRFSILAALNMDGFVGWGTTEGTFTRDTFHATFVDAILPHVGAWPGRISIVIMDNASIHVYPQLALACQMRGAVLLYLPPYSPQLNPIEVGFNLLKHWLQRHCTVDMWRCAASGVIHNAMYASVTPDNMGMPGFAYCGYEVMGVLGRMLKRRMRTRVQTRFWWMRGLNMIVQPSDDETSSSSSPSSMYEDNSDHDGDITMQHQN